MCEDIHSSALINPNVQIGQSPINRVPQSGIPTCRDKQTVPTILTQGIMYRLGNLYLRKMFCSLRRS